MSDPHDAGAWPEAKGFWTSTSKWVLPPKGLNVTTVLEAALAYAKLLNTVVTVLTHDVTVTGVDRFNIFPEHDIDLTYGRFNRALGHLYALTDLWP